VGGSVLEAEAVGQLIVLGGVLVDKALEELAQKVAVEGSGGNDGHKSGRVLLSKVDLFLFLFLLLLLLLLLFLFLTSLQTGPSLGPILVPELQQLAQTRLSHLQQ